MTRWHAKQPVCIREARSSDLAGLCAIRYHNKPAIHRDRITESDGRTLQYFVAEIAQQIVGFGILYFERPHNWTNVINEFPVIIDLFVAGQFRGRGVGRVMISYMEQVARQHGNLFIHLNVEPQTNPGALSLYQRLGYAPLHEKPYRNVWIFTDSDGVLHEGEEWVLDMQKDLTT